MESAQRDVDSDLERAEFKSVLAMDTSKQQLHNTLTFPKLKDKRHTDNIFEDSYFEDIKEQ